MSQNSNFLSSMGIYGLNAIEDAILSAFVTTEPILLIGAHGSAKTLLAERLAEALGMNFYAYDASKVMFEDVIGFPNPETISRGTIEYVPTPISIWDKEIILIDEISRATPSMQNKWLEIVRSRRVMGLKIDNLKYIIAAMNPTGYLGSLPLDAALAGRFAYIISMPDIDKMELDDIKMIINHISKADAPGLKIDHYRIGNSKKHLLKQFISQSTKRFGEIKKRYGDLITKYVTGIIPSVNNGLRPLNGRRLGMLWRNCLAYLSVASVKRNKNSFNEKELGSLLLDCLKMSLPYQATGEEVSSLEILNRHHKAMKMLQMSNSGMTRSFQLNLNRNPLATVEKYERNWESMTETEHQNSFSNLEENLSRSEELETLLLNFLALKKLVALYVMRKTNISADLLRRILVTYKKFTIPGSSETQFLILSFLSLDYLERIDSPNIDFNDKISTEPAFIALKLLNISNNANFHMDERSNAIRLYNGIKNIFSRINEKYEQKNRKQPCASQPIDSRQSKQRKEIL